MMSSNAGSIKTSKPRRHPWRWIAAATFFVMVVFVTRFGQEPTYDGKRASDWFGEALARSPNSESSIPLDNAFVEMEGDAVRFLVDRFLESPFRSSETYGNFFRRMPAAIRSVVPQPRFDTNVYVRTQLALALLGKIGHRQQTLADDGTASQKPNISAAIPVIREALRSPDWIIRQSAEACVIDIGPAAAPAVPELVALVTRADERTPALVIMALGKIGPSASNAVPTLMQTIVDPRFEGQRHVTFEALGEIGKPARTAISLLVRLLSGTNAELAHLAARAIADIGYTPDEAVPTFEKQLTGDANGRRWAAVALWNRNRDDTNYSTAILSELRSSNKFDKLLMLTSLRRRGVEADPFVPEIQKLTNDCSEVADCAKQALRKIQPRSP